jgi:hypothetical protein
LAFSWIRLNLGFLLREKLAAVLIIPSSWGFQLDGDLHQHTVPHQGANNLFCLNKITAIIITRMKEDSDEFKFQTH